jgi:hypothetical protein
MANVTANMTVVTKEAQYVFESTCLAYKTMDNQYDNQYEYTQAAAGSVINIKQPHRQYVTDGRSASGTQDDEERTIAMPRATWKKIVLGFNAQELAQDLTKEDNANKFFGKSRFKSSVQSMSAAIDGATFANVAPQVFNYVRGGETTDPSSYSDVGLAKAKLDNYHADAMDRCWLLTPDAEVSLNAGLSGLFNNSKQIDSNFDTGELSSFNGFKFYSSTYLPRHTNGTAATGAVKTTLSVEGVSQMVLDTLTTTTVLAGDRFTVAGVYRRDYVSKEIQGDLQQFVVTSATATVAGEATIDFSPAIETLATNAYASVGTFPQATAVVTFAGRRGLAQSIGMAYQKQAFALAFIDLPKIGVTTEGYVRDADAGYSMKISGQGDILELKSVMRMDALFGSVAVNPWWAVIVYGK